jgi:methionine synthase II (cobalamin-independent)
MSIERDYVMALAEALRQEYLEVYRAGLIVQVDDAVHGQHAHACIRR